jgi:lipopolysaccharide export system protein LptC
MDDGKLEALNTESREQTVNRGYSRFVKSLRFILPLIAVILVVVIMAWPEMEDKIIVVDKEDILPNAESDIGQNELLNPNFKTTDAQSQPIHVTAARALQNQENPNVVKLDKPNADIKTKDGTPIHIKALEGTYEQQVEKLFLKDNVTITHGSGYQLQAQELRVNMQTREAFSALPVTIDGPAAHITAVGLEGNVGDGVLIFKGPAQLTLKAATEAAAPEKKTTAKQESASEVLQTEQQQDTDQVKENNKERAHE